MGKKGSTVLYVQQGRICQLTIKQIIILLLSGLPYLV